MKPIKFICLMVLLTPSFLIAQNLYSLSGEVVNSSGEKILAGEVYMLQQADSALVSKVPIVKGTFSFLSIKNGQYLLKTSSLGFRDDIRALALQNHTDILIRLETAPAVLEEVTVMGTKKTFVDRNGNLLVNVENSPLSSIPDPMTLLSRLPSVQVSPDGESVSVVGKGQPLIYIDNQKMSINDLLSLSVADIKTIELINNPSAKYEAEGRVVILVTRKANRSEGTRGELTATTAYRKYLLQRNSASISVRKKKVEWKGNVQFNHLKTWEGNAFDFRIASEDIISRYNVTAVTTRPQFVGEGGVFYQINETDYVSFNTNARYQNESFPVNTVSYLQHAALQEDVDTQASNIQPVVYYSSRLNYNKNFSAARTLIFAGLQHTGYREVLNSNIFNRYDNQGMLLSQERQQKNRIGVIAARVDVEKTLTKDMKWETGSSVTRASSDGNSVIHNFNPTSELNAGFDYGEINYSAYTQLSGKRKKVQYSAGVRLEDTNVQSNSRDDNRSSSINKRTTQFFPKASVTVQVDSSTAITGKYAKTVTRPNYTNANQTTVYVNPYFEWSNNVNINPSITQEVSTTLQYKGYSVTAALYQIKGPMYAHLEYNSQQTRLRRSEINYERESGVSVSVSVPVRYKSWTSTNFFNAYLNNVQDPSADAGRSRPFVYCYSSNEVKLPHQFIFTVSGWAVTKSYQGAFERNALFAVDTALSKTLFKNLVCTVRFNDMFGSVNPREKFAINAVAANGIYYDNGREFAVGLKYSFGKLANSRFKTRDVDENPNRVR